jgi:hypothetical protein
MRAIEHARRASVSTGARSRWAFVALLLASIAAVATRAAAQSDEWKLCIVARLLDQRGEPVPAEKLDAGLSVRGKDGFDAILVQAANLDGGRVRLDASALASATQRILVVTNREYGLRLDLSQQSAGELQLGDVRLAAPPVLVTGRVVDAQGRPVHDAEIQLERRWIGRLDDPPTWNTTYAHASTNREGRFELRAWVGVDELRVGARKRGSLPISRELHAGAADVELCLRAGGALEGRALLDEACRINRLEIDCVRDGASVAKGCWREDGAFSVVGLDPGEYELQFRAYGELESAVTLSAIAVAAGETKSDERLASVDLRAKFRCFRVQLETAPGDESSFVNIFVRPAGAGSFVATSERASFELFTAARALDLCIDAPGYRFVRMNAIDGDRTVALKRGLGVRVTLAGERSTLPAGLELRADLQPLATDFTRYGSRTVAFDARGEVLLRASDPGGHRVVVYVRRIETGEDFMLDERAMKPSRIDVLEQVAERELSVELDREALQRLTEHLMSNR